MKVIAEVIDWIALAVALTSPLAMWATWLVRGRRA